MTKEKPQHIYINARPGDPSVLWIGVDSGKYYRTMDEAQDDNGKNTLDRQKLEITKSAAAPKKSYWPTIILVAIIAGLAYWIFFKK